jgi:nickel-dependent lactate racemase
MKTVTLRYGMSGLELRVPDSAVVLEAPDAPALSDADRAIADALAHPIASPLLAELVAGKRPKRVAITISDVTRPVPNETVLRPILEVLNARGIEDTQIVIIIGTGMHRPSTPAERDAMLGGLARRIEVIDHAADRPEALTRISDDPPVSVCRWFVEADFRIVTGYIEPHFMAGFSGGRKGVCPALVDLATIQRFHGYETLADPRADTGILDGNPCHEIALRVAQAVGVDFLCNVALTRERAIAGIYCGDLVEAHLAGCRDVARWSTADIDGPFDLVVTNGGGYPLDQTFYQTVKGMCTALPALDENSTLLQVTYCHEGLGSKAYQALLLLYGKDWQRFLSDIAANKDETRLDQWELQLQARVLERIGVDRLLFISDGIPADVQQRIAVTPVLGEGPAAVRAQRALDEFVATNAGARLAVIPDGPYTMLRRTSH